MGLRALQPWKCSGLPISQRAMSTRARSHLPPCPEPGLQSGWAFILPAATPSGGWAEHAGLSLPPPAPKPLHQGEPEPLRKGCLSYRDAETYLVAFPVLLSIMTKAVKTLGPTEVSPSQKQGLTLGQGQLQLPIFPATLPKRSKCLRLGRAAPNRTAEALQPCVQWAQALVWGD